MSIRPAKVFLGCLLLIMSACGEKQDSVILKALKGYWTTTNALGEVETICFGENRILWHCGTEDQYEIQYQVASYHETERYVCIRLRSERRTGTDAWIEHLLRFNEDFDEFIMTHGKDKFETIDGIFKTKKI